MANIYTAVAVYEISQTESIWFTKATLSGLQSTLAKLNLTIWVTNPIRNSKIWFTKNLFR